MTCLEIHWVCVLKLTAGDDWRYAVDESYNILMVKKWKKYLMVKRRQN